MRNCASTPATSKDSRPSSNPGSPHSRQPMPPERSVTVKRNRCVKHQVGEHSLASLPRLLVPRQSPLPDGPRSAWLHLILDGSASVDPLHSLDVFTPRIGGLTSRFWRDLQGDDVAVRGKEVLQACVAGCHQDPLGHLREEAGAGQFLAGLRVAPYDLLGGVRLQPLEGLTGMLVPISTRWLFGPMRVVKLSVVWSWVQATESFPVCRFTPASFPAPASMT